MPDDVWIHVLVVWWLPPPPPRRTILLCISLVRFFPLERLLDGCSLSRVEIRHRFFCDRVQPPWSDPKYCGSRWGYGCC